LSPSQAKAWIKERGWDVQALARRWRLSRTWVSMKINDAGREPHWTDAIAGLPLRSALPLPEQHRTIRRRAAAPTRRWLPKGRFLDRTLELGSEVIVEHELGEDAPEGSRGLVVAIRDETPPKVRILFESGHVDWFDAEAFVQVLHLTGRTLPSMTRYFAGSDHDIRRDLVRGRLSFRFPG
jgi:hypothetical protein